MPSRTRADLDAQADYRQMMDEAAEWDAIEARVAAAAAAAAAAKVTRRGTLASTDGWETVVRKTK